MPLRTQQGSQYRWNATARRYVDARGRFISAKVLRAEIDRALASATQRVRALALQLRAGEITLPEWELAMRGLSKEVHLYNAAAARGGWAQMAPADVSRVARVVRSEYAFIRRLAGEIATGLPLDGRFLVRTELYAQAGRETFHMVERQVQLEQGKTLERSILGVADHCDLCVSEAARGWVPIGQLIPIGQRTCLRRCKCRIEYSSLTDIDARAASVPPKLRKEPEGPYRAKYASAVGDMETCDHCMAFDGVVVEVSNPRRLPDHGCTSPRGCQCTWIYIRKEEPL